jgi:hypothetical protein
LCWQAQHLVNKTGDREMESFSFIRALMRRSQNKEPYFRSAQKTIQFLGMPEISYADDAQIWDAAAAGGAPASFELNYLMSTQMKI